GLVKMITDDVSKRDSVSKILFRRLANPILRTVISGTRPTDVTTTRTTDTPACLWVSLHSLWVMEAIRVDVIVVQALEGNNGLSRVSEQCVLQ
ncbi:hypothetical protein SARC_14043, partial [Sphaeroforma arctica JP610]